MPGERLSTAPHRPGPTWDPPLIGEESDQGTCLLGQVEAAGAREEVSWGAPATRRWAAGLQGRGEGRAEGRRPACLLLFLPHTFTPSSCPASWAGRRPQRSTSSKVEGACLANCP